MKGSASFLKSLKVKGDSLYMRVMRFLILIWSIYILASNLDSSLVFLIFSTSCMQMALNSAMKSMKLFLMMASTLGARVRSASDCFISYNSRRIYS